MKKYEFTDEIKEVNGVMLRRIRAVRNFGNIKAGDLGGWIESEDNLSQAGDSWVYDDAKVYGSAVVSEDAKIRDEAVVCGEAEVCGYAFVVDEAVVCGEAEVCGYAFVVDEAVVCGEAKICGCAVVGGNATIKNDRDYIVFKNWWSSGRHFTWTRSNDKYKVGCFYGSGEELIKKAYADSEESGREYERIVRYVDSIKQE